MAIQNKGWQAHDKYIYLNEKNPITQIMIELGVHVTKESQTSKWTSIREHFAMYPEVHDIEERVATLLNISRHIPTEEIASRLHDRGEIEHLMFHEKAADRIMHGQSFVITRGDKSYLAYVIDSEQAADDEGLVDTTVAMSNSEIPDAPRFIERNGVIIPHLAAID